MSTEYDFYSRVGFVFKAADVIKPFAEKVREESHREERFDPKTGKKSGTEKVVDREAHVRFTFNGKLVGTSDEEEPEEDDALYVEDRLVNLIALKAKCKWWKFGDLNGSGKDIWYVFGPHLPQYVKNHGLNAGRVTSDGGLDFQTVAKQTAKLKQIGTALKKMGLKPGKPKVELCWDIT